MSRRPKTSRPRLVVLDPLTARVIRGPHKADQNKWYWRISEGRAAAGCLWATRAEITQEMARRVAGVEKPQEVDNGPNTFGELTTRWLEQQKRRTDLAPLTIKTWQTVTRHLMKIGGEWPLDEVKNNFHLFRDLADRSKQTLTSDLKIARRIMHFGELKGWCSAVVPHVPLRGDDPERRTPTADRAEEILNLIDRHEYKVAYSIIRVTGCRGVAVDRLTWENVDYDQGELTLIGKGGGKRDVPVPRTLLAKLKTWQEAQDNPTEGNVFSQHVHNKLRIKVQRVCQANNLPHFGLHGLRRLRVREYRRGGVDVVVAAALLGHSPLVMMRMYDAASKEEKHEAMAKLWAQENGEQDPDA